MFAPILIVSLITLAIPVARAEVFEVTVGGPGLLKFDPEFVNANPGDLVRFTFKQKNHTITQSTLASPCSPLEGGFDSGFVPVGDDAVDFPLAELEVVNINPTWAYCKQGAHCSQGMVFAVNPGEKMDQFRSAATNEPIDATTTTAPIALSTSIVPSTTSTSISYTTAPAAAAPASPGVDHKIIVGGPGKLLYDPSSITANVGDTVTFEFRQKSHSVTQSSFVNPCVPLTSESGDAQGFDSGLMPVAADAVDNFPNYTIQINDTNVIWGYCRQATHCQQGMVFSINADETSDKSFEAFKAAALSASTESITSSTGNNNSALPISGSSNNAGIVSTIIMLMLGSSLL